ncbi:MAG: hypothetical protein GVY12_01625 [Bacteroidetes bacterium]|nr:hypothetical protein [Bacteroidota bacterium]
MKPSTGVPSKSVQQQRLTETRAHALHLMTELGQQVLSQPLQALGWAFGFDRAKRRLGACHYQPGHPPAKRITLSRHFVRLNGLAYRNNTGLQVIDDVIRHEIAHAIDYEQRGRSDHSAPWQAICQQVGADPSRLYEGNDLERVPGTYVVECPQCGQTDDFYKRPKNVRYCKPCSQRAGRRFDPSYRMVLRERATGKEVAYGDERKTRRPALDASGATPAEQGYKYTATCPSCGRQTGFKRKVTRTYVCVPCCTAHANGQAERRFVLKITQNY